MNGKPYRWAGSVAAGILALDVAWVRSGWGGALATQAFSDLISVFTAGAAALLCWAASRRDRGRIRRGWFMLGLGMASWSAGELLWSWYEVVQQRPVPFPSAADVGFLAMIPLAAGGLLSLHDTARWRWGARTLLDAMLIAGALLFVSWATVLGPQFHEAEGSLLKDALTLAYPLGDVILVSVVLAVYSALSGGRVAVRLLAAGLTALGVADSGFSILTLNGTYATGSLIDPVWDLGFLLIAVGALRHEAGVAVAEPGGRVPSRRGALLLPYGPIVLAVLVAGWKQYEEGYGPFLFWNGIVLVVVGLTRQCLALLDNAKLTRDLEAKVETRTEELRHSERRFRSLVQNASDVIAVIGSDTAIRYVSPSAGRVLGFAPEELLGTRLADLAHPADADHVLRLVPAASAETGTALVKWRCRHRDGRWLQVESLSGDFSDDPDGPAFVVDIRDVSERAALEARLQQAERLESLGQLAGGVAHDFNNLLVVIRSCADFVTDALPDPPPPGWEPLVTGIRSDADVISRAAERGADLTSQMLVFARRDRVDARVLDVNDVVGRAEDLLRRTLGEHITLETQLRRPLGAVRADPRRLEQVLVNLAVNARDAMEPGGQLAISTGEVVVTPSDPIDGLDPGRYVCITETDTGCGMPPEVATRAFEPFFTTKPKGHGTGLGLATVFGIVTDAGGQVRLESETGRGTAVRVYLPALDDVSAAASAGPGLDDLQGRGETVLLVEDEALVRAVAGRILTERGYDVVPAADAAAALRLCRDCGRRIDVVLTDVVMPGLSGPELIDEIRALRPDVPALFMSGYPADFLTPARGRAVKGTVPEVIPKPFTPTALLRGVRRALDRPTTPRRGRWG
jgi:PAS domain S-box-containing protein